MGDFALENPFSWTVGTVTLKFPGTPFERPAEESHKAQPVIEVWRVGCEVFLGG